MNQPTDTVLVFTAHSRERILREGGSGAWVLNPVRAQQCAWLVCAQNRHGRDETVLDATAPHGSAFLLGKISALRPVHDSAGRDRWMIEISEFAPIDRPCVWNHGRNPIRYTSLEELGISLDGVEFQPLRSSNDTPTPTSARRSESPPAMLTIAEAKEALAATFGVKPEAVEITIRG